MRNKYTEEEMLMLSGIQHFFYCERQWALIHLEQQWEENSRTVEGQFVHKKVDDPFVVESRGNTVIARSVPLGSYSLGLYGIADVIEFHKIDQNGLLFENKTGSWMPVPVEYKRGKPKPDERDEIQLCAQAICIEELNGIKIDKGYLYYHSIKRRDKVLFDADLRGLTYSVSEKMHDMFKNRETPKVPYGKNCKWCSMYEICQPKITGKKKKVKQYIKRMIDESCENS